MIIDIFLNMLYRLNSCICVFFLLLSQLQADDFNIGAQSATALNEIVLYPDSSFFKHSNIRYGEGALFDIVEISDLEHEDADQNQKFKWFKVKSRSDSQEGWVYGDGLAVHSDQHDLSQKLQPFHQKKISLNNGFENALLWVASINGRDNLHQKDYLNPIYNEYYLVITNSMGRSVHLKCSGASAMGESNLKQLKMKDLTGDGIPEFIIQKSIVSTGSDLEDRTLEVYSLQAGTLVKVFEERMTLTFDNNLASPSLYKQVQVEEDLIRIAYVDYVKSNRSNLGAAKDDLSSSQTRCLEYVTYSLVWDKQQKKFRSIYNKSISALNGKPIKISSPLLTKPDLRSASTQKLRPTDNLWLIKHYESYEVVDGKKKVQNYFKVQTDSGQTGYLLANDVQIEAVEQASLLNRYYQNPPLFKNNWSSARTFLSFN